MTSDTIENKPQEPMVQEKPDVETKVDIPVADTAASKEQEEDLNFKAFREGRKKDRVAREEAERRAAQKEEEVAALKAAMEAAFSKQTERVPKDPYSSSYQQEESQEDLIDKKVQAALAVREQKYRKESEERERAEAPQKIQKMYPDFSKVVSQENCDYIDYHYPELAAPFTHMPEGVEKWSAMYNLIKKIVPNAASSKKEAMRADINMNKPRSMSTTGITQPQAAQGGNFLSEERKAANWARMQQSIKSIG